MINSAFTLAYAIGFLVAGWFIDKVGAILAPTLVPIITLSMGWRWRRSWESADLPVRWKASS